MSAEDDASVNIFLLISETFRYDNLFDRAAGAAGVGCAHGGFCAAGPRTIEGAKEARWEGERQIEARSCAMPGSIVECLNIQ